MAAVQTGPAKHSLQQRRMRIAAGETAQHHKWPQLASRVAADGILTPRPCWEQISHEMQKDCDA